MKKIIFAAIAAVVMIACGSSDTASETVLPDGVVQSGVVHRVLKSLSTYYRPARASVRLKSGVNLKFEYIEETDLQYLQSGDTLYYYYSGKNPVFVRVGFAD